MGIFSRLRDIIHSNINTMLEMAEDPEKLIKLMIQEMEDTLVEIKANCAAAMATRKRIEREVAAARAKVEEWANKAELAVGKGREDLAREALKEKRRLQERLEGMERELENCDGVVAKYKDDIAALEQKLTTAREKHRVLVQRHIHASQSKRAQEKVREADAEDAFVRFQKFENRIERMEAEANLVNHGRKPSLKQEFEDIAKDDEIEKELDSLRNRVKGGGSAGL